MLKDISIDELQPGMYVSRVLEQTGSMRVRSGGLVKSEAIIEQTRQHTTVQNSGEKYHSMKLGLFIKY